MVNTLFTILKVTNARRDVILVGGLNHRFPWRHHPPYSPAPLPRDLWWISCAGCAHCVAVHVRGTDSNKSNLMNYRWGIPESKPGNFMSISMLCSTFARHLLAAATLVDCLFSRDDFDCSVIYTWGIDKSKAVIGGVIVPQMWREHLSKNGSWILIGWPRERYLVRL